MLYCQIALKPKGKITYRQQSLFQSLRNGLNLLTKLFRQFIRVSGHKMKEKLFSSNHEKRVKPAISDQPYRETCTRTKDLESVQFDISTFINP